MGVSTRVEMRLGGLSALFSVAEDRMYNAKLMESKLAYNAIVEGVLQDLLDRGIEKQDHIDRMQGLARSMAEGLQLDAQEKQKLIMLAAWHDIGNIAVPEEILLKPGELCSADWEQIKKHSEMGYRLAHTVTKLKPIADAILYHHEHWDGGGYPQQLKGKNIPLLSRILGVMEAFDVMTHPQVYKAAIPEQKAIATLMRMAGRQFDPEIVQNFIAFCSRR
jgi:HD-GYP domain-containing protein (c-di-GMP phosphodiesterase class II)